jgi:type II secretory pathway pseudopilin PulG
MSSHQTKTRNRSPSLGRGGRNGITLVEIVAAVSVLAVLLATSVQMLSALSQRGRAAERRTLANETAQAMVEQLASMRWDDLTPQAAERLAVPDQVQPFLPGAKLEAVVVDEQEPVAAKRIFVKLTWTSPGGQPAGPVQLTAWSFPDEPPPAE